MGIKEIARKVGTATKNAGRQALQEREKRGRTLEFQRAIAQEKAELGAALRELGSSALDAGIDVTLKVPFHLFIDTIHALFSEKYRSKGYAEDIKKLFFGHNGVAYRVGTVVKNLAYAGFKFSKVSTRELFKF